MKKFIAIVGTLIIIYACGGGSEVKKEGDQKQPEGKQLGKESILVKEPLSRKYDTIIIPDFSFENTSIQQVDETKHPDYKETVNKLGVSVPDQIAAYLKEWKIFRNVVRVKKSDKSRNNAVVLNGRFTTISAGNRALRFWVGFGAGTSTVGIDGELVDSSNDQRLARFLQNRHSPASMKDYHAVFAADGKNLAKDIALFIKKLY